MHKHLISSALSLFNLLAILKICSKEDIKLSLRVNRFTSKKVVFVKENRNREFILIKHIYKKSRTEITLITRKSI